MRFCERHAVVTPSRVTSLAIIEGHVDLLRGSCGLCGLTVVGVDAGNGPAVEWFAVAGIVISERRYQRRLLVETLVDPVVHRYVSPAELLIEAQS
jgi:hypothetical protein